MKILNLTQHPSTPEQIEAGAVDCHPLDRDFLKSLLTFEALPKSYIVYDRAMLLSHFAKNAHRIALEGDWHEKFDAVMIGGASFLMPPLEAALKPHFKVLYAFSKHVSVEKVMDDGSVIKTSVFKHAGFVEAK